VAASRTRSDNGPGLPYLAAVQPEHVEVAGGALARRGPAGVVCRPALFERLATAARVTQVSAPAGSGKTLLLRSWIAEAGLIGRAAWVSVPREERDAQRFWLAVLDALRATAAGAALVGPLTAAPELDGGAIVERLLADLGSLEEPLWLLLDDVHEMRSAEALAQLQLLVLRAPPQLRLVLVTRRELRLGLHRLRLEGELTELRAEDLRFTYEEARTLLAAAGVQLSDATLARLMQRTEGWVAGLRLAALALAGHPDPERFAVEFSGSERTVAEYLLAEVLERQPEQVRLLLLRTSILERVTGPLADLLTGSLGGERILQELEEANAFVVALDAGRSWFRYHPLFADLLQLQLRRSALDEVPALHAAAAGWLAGHGYPIEAIRHAQAAQDWRLAARLLFDHWSGLRLDGRAGAGHELLGSFPAGAVAADPELAALRAADQLARGSLAEAERYLMLASRRSESCSPDRQEGLQVALAVVRLSLGSQRGDMTAVVEQVERLLAPAGAPDPAQPGGGDELRAVALTNLGIAELWTGHIPQAERHLEQAIALARRADRHYLELTGLAHLAHLAAAGDLRSHRLAAQRSRQAIELARQHGWGDEPITGVAYAMLGATLAVQGRLEEAEPWLEHAERTLQPAVQPAAGLVLRLARGLLELGRGREHQALADFRSAERLRNLLISSHVFAQMGRAIALHTLVRMGQTERVEQALSAMDQQERDSVEMRTVVAALRLARGDPAAAITVLAPVLGGSGPVVAPRNWAMQALLVEATASYALGDPGAAERALERALDLAEPDGLLSPFLIFPVPGLLERHRRHTGHAALITDILDLLAGNRLPPPRNEAEPLHEPLSESETRVLRYLPTNLSAPEIAGELHLSVNTVKTHMRRLYAKLGIHRRAAAVDRARALGLLAPSARRL
jgi:LuxR family maltose regulon positive regulatory protein